MIPPRTYEQGSSVNPDYFALWSEITLDRPLPVQTQCGRNLQEKWRAMEGSSFEDRLMFIIAACEAECPGLWLDIASAAVRKMDEQDHAFWEDVKEQLANAEKLSSEAMQTLRKKQIQARIDAFCRGHLK